MTSIGSEFAMITINITGFLTDFTAGRNVIQLSTAPDTVGEALSELWELYPGLRDRVLTERGQVRMHVNVFLEAENIRRKQLLDTQLPENCEITILPSVSGGAEKLV
jgi:molybdopterin synthase sulfur carrier subunit